MVLKAKKFFIFGSLFYFLILILGIISAKKSKILFKEVPLPKATIWDFIFALFFFTLFFFALIKFLKQKKIQKKIFKILFLISVISGGLILFNVWLSPLLSLILILLLAIWWLKNPNILNQNLLVALGIAGACLILGQMLNPASAILLLIIFSIYDIFAVYKTKHMIKMAKAMVEARAILGIFIPKEISVFKAKIEKLKPGDFLILGGGDVAFPLLFSISLIPYGILKSLIVAIFASVGLILNFLLLFKQKERKPIPALPLIALFSIFGYLIIKYAQ